MTARAHLVAIFGVGFVLAVTAWLVLSSGDGGRTESATAVGVSEESAATATPRSASARPTPSNAEDPRSPRPTATTADVDPITRAARALAEARSEHAAAAHALVEAQRAIDELEHEVEAVERFVEEIEARGDDPARHAFEGMERLGPVIDRYEARLADLEAADARAEAAARALERAEADLARAQSVTAPSIDPSTAAP